MEKVYTSYTRKIGDTTYFFVKKYTLFPEQDNIPPILESYGMHTDLSKACKIAGVDQSIRELMQEEISGNIHYARVINLMEASSLRQKTS
jgi:hypothetical protein